MLFLLLASPFNPQSSLFLQVSFESFPLKPSPTSLTRASRPTVGSQSTMYLHVLVLIRSIRTGFSFGSLPSACLFLINVWMRYAGRILSRDEKGDEALQGKGVEEKEKGEKQSCYHMEWNFREERCLQRTCKKFCSKVCVEIPSSISTRKQQ